MDRIEQQWVDELIAEKKEKEENKADIYSALTLLDKFIKNNEK